MSEVSLPKIESLSDDELKVYGKLEAEKSS